MAPGEEQKVYQLICRVFTEFVAPEFAQEGVDEFLRYATPESLIKRTQADHFVLLALFDGRIIGIIEVRHHRHIALLFVDGQHHGIGIASELIQRAATRCIAENRGLRSLNVNASPNSVSFYQSLGFVPTAGEQTHNGIRFVPMLLEMPRCDVGEQSIGDGGSFSM
jgi:GNAT superfamily N-acetyltransferase